MWRCAACGFRLHPETVVRGGHPRAWCPRCLASGAWVPGGERPVDSALAAAERPLRPQTAWSQGQALFNLGRFAEAEVAVDRCLRLAAETPGCWLLRANVLDKQGKATEAIEAFEQAQALRAE